MSSFLGYACSVCRREYGPGRVVYVCPEDGGNLDVLLDLDSIRQSVSTASIEKSGDVLVSGAVWEPGQRPRYPMKRTSVPPMAGGMI